MPKPSIWTLYPDLDDVGEETRKKLSTHTMVDCFVTALERVFTLLQKDQPNIAKLAMLINVLINNSKVKIHGEPLRQLFGIAFRVFLKRYKKGDSLEEQSKNFVPVENFINLILGRCDTSSQSEMNNVLKRELATSASKANIFAGNTAPTLLNSPSNPFDHSLSSISNSNHQYQSPQMTFKRVPSVAKYPEMPSSGGLRSIDDKNSSSSVSNFFGKDTSDESLERYIGNVMTYMKDQVEIYFARTAKLRQGFKKSEEEFAELAGKCIPVQLVPPTAELANSPLYSRVISVEIPNEMGERSGLYGWCFICRKAAEYYCKDNKLPVCSKICKEQLIHTINRVDKLNFSNTRRTFSLSNTILHSPEENMYRLDSLAILDYVLDLVLIEKETPQKNDIVLASLTDCFLIIVERAGVTLAQNSRFKEILSKRIMSCLAPLIVLYSPRVTQTACNVLLVLFKRFRSLLKVELYSILEKVVLAAIESGFMSPPQQQSLLNFCTTLISSKDVSTDLYVNYDCSSGYGNVLDHTLEVLCKGDDSKPGSSLLPPSVLDTVQRIFTRFNALSNRQAEIVPLNEEDVTKEGVIE